MLARFGFLSRRVEAVPVVLVHQGASLSRDKYDEIVRRLSQSGDRLESPSDWPVAGLLSHAAGDAPSGFRVVDVWESEEACRQFGEVLMPILEEVGVTAQPELYPAHAFVHA